MRAGCAGMGRRYSRRSPSASAWRLSPGMWCRPGPFGTAEPEFPDQLVRRLPSDPHPFLVDAEEVMRCANAEQIRLVVAAAMGPIFDVVQVHGGPAAARNLAAVAAASENPGPLRHPLLHVRFPDVPEV